MTGERRMKRWVVPEIIWKGVIPGPSAGSPAQRKEKLWFRKEQHAVRALGRLRAFHLHLSHLGRISARHGCAVVSGRECPHPLRGRRPPPSVPLSSVCEVVLWSPPVSRSWFCDALYRLSLPLTTVLLPSSQSRFKVQS